MSDAPKRRSSKVDSGCSSASDGGRKFRYCRDKTSRPEPIYEFLAKKFAYLSEEGWKDLIKNSQHIDTSSIGVANAATVTTPYVMVNTSVCSDPHYILQQQDLIGFVAPAVLEPDVDETFTVLYDDPCMIAVCKSGNIPVCTGGRYRHNTLERVVYSYLCAKQDSTAAASSTSPPPPPAIYPVHRLDKETSGVTIFAKTKGVSQRLSMLFGSKEEAITPNHAHTKDESSDISSRCSPDTLLLQLSPYAQLHVGWRHASTDTSVVGTSSSVLVGVKRSRGDEGGGSTAASLPSSSSAVSLILRKEYSAVVHSTTPSCTAVVELPLDIKYRIGFAGEAVTPPTDSVRAAEVVSSSTSVDPPSPGASVTHIASVNGPTAELSRKELKRQMWQLRSKKRVEEGVRTEMAEGSIAMSNQQSECSYGGGASSLQALHNPTGHATTSTTPSSSKFLNSMAMKCFPIDDISHGKDAHTRIHSITPFGDGSVLKEVSCQIFTGRTHQIRCHLAAIGMPIVGDKLYSSTPTTSPSSDRDTGVVSPSLAFPPYQPRDTPDDEQSFFGKCRGTKVVEACEGYQAVRHCLHAAKVTVPLGLLLGQYDTNTKGKEDGAAASMPGGIMASLEVLIRSNLSASSLVDADDCTKAMEKNVQRLRAFEQYQSQQCSEVEMVPVAALILDASSLAQFDSALVKMNPTK